MFPETWKFEVAGPINDLVDWLLATFSVFFDGISSGVLTLLLQISSILEAIPWFIYIIAIAAIIGFTSRRVFSTVFLALLPVIVGMFGLWDLAIESLAVVITAVVLALIIGIPMGMLMAEFNLLETIIRPILDAMQTMPSFVYLIPALMFFGLGRVPAVFATFIFAVPPIIRLTNLGLRLVPQEVQEAALSYGATRMQLLREVRIPLAMPSILAGVNQTTMMALSMVVIASMIGAGGLGYEVLISINRINVGRGFEAGISVVILAIVIDRLTQSFAKRFEPPSR